MHPTNATPRHTRTVTLLAAFVFSVLPARAQTQSPAPAATAAPTKDAAALKGEQEPLKLDTFVVTGIRAGIESAIESKRENTSIVETITAEDIGKLPDISIAESIARLPGLAAQRVDGAAQVISVRGLAPDFATTLLNGREQVSTGDNRGVEFDQYPSELIHRVLVQKTPDASLVSQGLSGTLGLQAVRPLSLGKRVLAFNVRGERKSLNNLGSDSKVVGNRISGTYVDQFANKTVGVALGYAHLESPILSQEFGTYGWSTNQVPNADRTGFVAGTTLTSGIKTFARSGMSTRDGLMGVLEWRPNSSFSSVIDAYYSKFRREQTNRGIETRLDGNRGSLPGNAASPFLPTRALAFTPGKLSNNALLSATVANVYPAVRNMYNDRKDKLTAFGWNGQYHGGKWIVTGDVSYSKAERTELNLETQAAQRSATNLPVGDTVSYDLTPDGFPTVSYGLNYADPASVKIGPTVFRAGYGKVPQIKDELTSYRVTASRSLNRFFDNIEVGFNYGDRQKKKDQPESRLQEVVANVPVPVAGAALLPDTTLNFAGTPGALSWNVPTVMALGVNFLPFTPGYGTAGIGSSSGAAAALVQKRWTVYEDVATSYAQFNLDSHLGSIRVRGNVGVQVKAVDQSSKADYLDRTEPVLTNQIKQRTDGKTYTDVLPSLNLAFELPHQQVLRVAAAKQVARPRLDQLRASFDFSINGVNGEPSGSGGNPRLAPWRANAFDVSYEKYFAKKGYIAVAGFYKDIKSYIFDLTTEHYDFSEFTAGDPLATTNFGRFAQPLNGRGGKLKGLEFTLSVPLNLLTETLDGFGVIASLSKTDSAITLDNTNLGSSVKLPGLSDTVTNLTAYYEKSGFSARVSRRWRSDFVGEITAFANDRALRFVSGEAVVDMQVGYTFQSGPLKGLGLLLQAYNVTDAAYRTYRQTHAQIEEFQKYGRTYLLGANYRF
ncbi:MAG: TonB-dependent receptor [Opitutae bacterium]|nr:TonB-dependent receptor [Opitutae bacterium]